MSTILDLGPVMPVPKGVWDSTKTYERNNLVTHDGAAWICGVATSTGVAPGTSNTSDWFLLVENTTGVTSIELNGEVKTGKVIINTSSTPVSHASEDTTYGAGDATHYGHVRVVDAVEDGESYENTAASPVMVLSVAAGLENALESANSLISEVSNDLTGTVGTVEALSDTVSEMTTSVDNAINNLTVSGKVITFTRNDGTTGTITTQDTNTDTKVTNTLNTTAKAYITGTTSSKTNTGTQVFDTGVYLTTTAGVLHCTKLEAGSGTIWVA